MATTAVERVFVDTNVLISATDHGRRSHRDSRRMVDLLPGRGITCYTSAQVVREYLAVATRPVDANGLGLNSDQAGENVAAWLERATVLPENRTTVAELMNLSEKLPSTGKQFHDLQVVATMRVGKIETLITDNVRHYRAANDGGFIRVLDVVEAAVELLDG